MALVLAPALLEFWRTAFPSSGVKQCCPLRPTLFGLFLDGLHRYIAVHCPHLGPALLDGTRVYNLQYADDVTLLACDPTHLQTLIDCAVAFCKAVGLRALLKHIFLLSLVTALLMPGAVTVNQFSVCLLLHTWDLTSIPRMVCFPPVPPGRRRCGEHGLPCNVSMLACIAASP
jgi:hypothetical protein